VPCWTDCNTKRSMEINLLSSRIVGYKQFESRPMAIGGNPGQKNVYSYGLVRNRVESGQVKVMEIVTIHDNLAYFIE
jgi:hypothetical protein